jgi:hypothetical protein
LAPIGEPIAPLTAPDHFVTPLGRSELIGLIGQPPLRHTHCAVAIWAHPEARLGPLAGHYPRRMPVIQGQLRAVPDDSSPACRRSGRDLPSWPCEFDSRHPLHNKTPSQGDIGASSKHRGESTPEIASWSCGSMFLPDLDDKPPCQHALLYGPVHGCSDTQARVRAILGPLRFRRPGKYLGVDRRKQS